MKLDRSSPFGITQGDPRVKYIQDGKEFDKDGIALDESAAAPPVVVDEEKHAEVVAVVPASAPAPLEPAPASEPEPQYSAPIGPTKGYSRSDGRFQLKRGR